MAQDLDPAPPAHPFSAMAPSRPAQPRQAARPTLMVTWAVGEGFGGMTAMCLKRAGLFHARGVPSAVVSFDAVPRFAAIRDGLVASGLLHPEVPIINLHEYYASGIDDAATPRPAPLDHQAVPWNHHSRTHRESDGSLFYEDHTLLSSPALSHREYFRPDGSVYLTDSMLPLAQNPQKARRVLCLLDSRGQSRGEFDNAASLYRHWLGRLVGTEPTDIIVDSKYSARFLGAFEHPLATKFYVFHSTHVAVGAPALTGKLSDAHQAIINDRENWDGLVFLTESQRRAFVGRFGDQGNTVVISNPVDGPAELPDFASRDKAKVVHVGRFTKGKNISEVIRIVHGVAAGSTPAKLVLVGDGDQRPALEQLVRELGMAELVDFRGHIDTVAQELATARVLLLCSRFEGQSLALLEAQAAGCVPVAYDVDFGPRDVISQGSTGFLAAPDDRDSAIAAVTRLLRDDALCQDMSRRAFAAAKEHTSDRTFGQWIEALDAVRVRQSPRKAVASMDARLSAVLFRPDGAVEIEIDADFAGQEIDQVELLVSARGNPEGHRVSCLPHRGSGAAYGFLLPADLRTALAGGDLLDVHIRFEADGVGRTVRLGAHGRPEVFPFLTVYGNLSFK